jgi:hypothetical protein
VHREPGGDIDQEAAALVDQFHRADLIRRIGDRPGQSQAEWGASFRHRQSDRGLGQGESAVVVAHRQQATFAARPARPQPVAVTAGCFEPFL